MGAIDRMREAQANLCMLAIERYRLLIPASADRRTVNALKSRGWISDTGTRHSATNSDPVYALNMTGFRFLLDYMVDECSGVEGVKRIADICDKFVEQYVSLEGYLSKHFGSLS